jgi:Ca-activated chloride channel homolog
VISLGDDRDERFLQELAEEAGGRAYFPDDARALPMLAAREAALVAGGRLVEESFLPRQSPHPMMTGLDPTHLPRLGGYVVSAAKPGAEVPLASHRLDPVVATWRSGLGKVAVYTADLHGRWSSQLRASQMFRPLLTQMVRWVARSSTDDSLYVKIHEQSDHATLFVETPREDGTYSSLLDLWAAIRRPSGETEQIQLPETMPGRYEVPFALSDPGPYIVSIEGRSHDGAFDGRVLRGFFWSAAAERRARGINVALLSQLRDTTGGISIDGRSSAWSTRESAFRDMRPWLLSAAFVLFLIELLLATVTTSFSRYRRGVGHAVEKSAAA